MLSDVTPRVVGTAVKVRCLEDGGPPEDEDGSDGVGVGGTRLPLGAEALDLTVTVTFKGVFSSRGYR